jgi:hypothetical protein
MTAFDVAWVITKTYADGTPFHLAKRCRICRKRIESNKTYCLKCLNSRKDVML